MTTPSVSVRRLRLRGVRARGDHHAAAQALLEQLATTADLSSLGVSAHIRSVRLRASEREIADGTAAARLGRALRAAVGEPS